MSGGSLLGIKAGVLRGDRRERQGDLAGFRHTGGRLAAWGTIMTNPSGETGFQPDRDAGKDRLTREASFDLEGKLMDAERTMMQFLQTSLSLIGFGITMNTFFQHRAAGGVLATGDQTAKGVGAGLLVVGLLLLGAGISTQAQYRHDLLRRYDALVVHATRGTRLGGRVTPSFLSAALLFIIGGGALLSMIIRKAL